MSKSPVGVFFWLAIGYASGMAVEGSNWTGRTEHWAGWKTAKPWIDSINAERGQWLANYNRDGQLMAVLRLRPTQARQVEIDAICLQRLDGRPLAVSDLAKANLGELKEVAHGHWYHLTDKTEREDDDPLLLKPMDAVPRRPGRAGRPREHWLRVSQLLEEADRVAPHRADTWFMERWAELYGKKWTLKTVAEWRKKVGEKREAGEL